MICFLYFLRCIWPNWIIDVKMLITQEQEAFSYLITTITLSIGATDYMSRQDEEASFLTVLVRSKNNFVLKDTFYQSKKKLFQV